jgi:hypothetical protein
MLRRSCLTVARVNHRTRHTVTQTNQLMHAPSICTISNRKFLQPGRCKAARAAKHARVGFLTCEGAGLEGRGEGVLAPPGHVGRHRALGYRAHAQNELGREISLLSGPMGGHCCAEATQDALVSTRQRPSSFITLL